LLSTPLTVVLVVLGKYVPRMQFLGILLGDEPVLSPAERFYQRLLALDSEEAIDLAHEYRRQMPLEKVYDEVLLPALAKAEEDRHRGALDERRRAFIRQAFRDIIEELGDGERSRAAVEMAKGKTEAGTEAPPSPKAPIEAPKRASVPADCTINVVCLPSRDEADEIASLMLAQLLEHRGYCAYVVSQTRLASEMLHEIEKKHADVVVVSALPPAAVAHARYLCKRVEADHPHLKMIVGLWTFSGNIDKARERITCVASVQLVTTLAAMQHLIDQFMHEKLAGASPQDARADAGSARATPSSPRRRP
jgi:methanogenic corrinoid protein MtbC1